jgi:hypothetical protein
MGCVAESGAVIDMNHNHDMDANRARSAALLTAELAGWAIDPNESAFFPAAYARYLVAPVAQALLVPHGPGSCAAVAMRAGRETRSDVVVVAAAADGSIRYSLSMTQGGREWRTGYRLWQGTTSASLWLAPDEAAGPSYELLRRPMRPSATAPWADSADRRAGFVRAASLIARRLGSD